MSLRTFSSFYYGHTVTPDNNKIDFDEGDGELTATINIGSYSATSFAQAIANAMNAVGTYTYTVTFNRTTRRITIATAGGAFDLLAATGTSVAVGLWTLMGFAATDVTGLLTYTGGNASGSMYAPQFKLQDHISTDDWRAASSATINKAANGRVEVVKFGDEMFFQGNISYVTNITQPDSVVIKNNATGLTELRSFMQYIINKSPIEFMPDIDTPATFIKAILESSPGFKDGTGYKLKEMYDKQLPGYFETGALIFRVVE